MHVVNEYREGIPVLFQLQEGNRHSEHDPHRWQITHLSLNDSQLQLQEFAMLLKALLHTLDVVKRRTLQE